MNARHYQGHWLRGQSEISIFFDIYLQAVSGCK